MAAIVLELVPAITTTYTYVHKWLYLVHHC